MSGNELWKRYCSILREGVEQCAHPIYLSGVQQLGASFENFNLSKIRVDIYNSSMWEIIFFRGGPQEAWYQSISEKKFPISKSIRSEIDIEAANTPDLFHDIFGHTPYFMNSEYVKLVNSFAEMWRNSKTPSQREVLKKTWFYVFEFSIILQEKSSQIIGSGILSSLPQLRKFRSGDFCVTKYDRNAIFESKISFNGEPNFFMGFNRFDELGVALIEIKRYINL